jgi:predicted adenylyl cyclase CyaB
VAAQAPEAAARDRPRLPGQRRRLPRPGRRGDRRDPRGARQLKGGSTNIEVKCRLRDRAAIEDRLESLGAVWTWTRRQRDTFFTVPRGWLKLREVEGATAELISYVRPTDDAGPRASEYDVLSVPDPDLVQRLLGRVLAPDAVVVKVRTLWLLEHTRIHLDRVDGLGDWLELETVVDGITPAEGEAESRRMVETLGLDEGDFVAVPYRDLLRE